MSFLSLSKEVYGAIRAHGEETYPHECCGALLGHPSMEGWRVTESVKAGNTRTDSAHNRYNIAPIELVRIQRSAREKGLEIAGFYHSHPDHPAQWSATDFAEAHWLGCSYVITSVVKGEAGVTNSFFLAGTTEEDKWFEKERIQVEESSVEFIGAPLQETNTTKDPR
ncbi:MAG TPA: M67 family metallopeptidase [Terracidiphilus sp.]|jgi:proteasome lid subunit RPN8/RPN11